MREKTKIGLILLAAVLLGVPLVGKLLEGNGIADYAGIYTMTTADGHPVPYTSVENGQQGIEIKSGTLTLNTDGTFISTMSYGSRPMGWPRNGDFKGTFAQDGSGLVLSWPGAGKTKVTVEGDKLTVNNEGKLFVYEK
jgi:hypothetical protein